MKDNNPKRTKKKSVSYSKWGYFFIAPFFIVYFIFSFIPQVLTIINSFFETYTVGMDQIGPNFVGLKNYIDLFTPTQTGEISILKYFGNTLIMWVLGAVPQILVALLLAVFFTSTRLKLKGQPFFKAVIYMPNLIMASAFSMLFFTLFSNVGPINNLIEAMGNPTIDFFGTVWTLRGLIALMNFLMWFGNTTILLMAGIMSIDGCLFEAAMIDGASSVQAFFKVTLPLLMPIITYVVITALIGGIQMFDVPQIMTNRLGNPDRSAMTVVIYLNSYIYPSKNYGMAGAISVILFIVSGLLSAIVFKSTTRTYKEKDTI